MLSLLLFWDRMYFFLNVNEVSETVAEEQDIGVLQRWQWSTNISVNFQWNNNLDHSEAVLLNK